MMVVLHRIEVFVAIKYGIFSKNQECASTTPTRESRTPVVDRFSGPNLSKIEHEKVEIEKKTDVREIYMDRLIDLVLNYGDFS